MSPLQQFSHAPTPPLGRMMIFIDGENLVFRYQNMLNKGYVPNENVSHHKDAYVWNKSTVLPDLNIVVRATYYTYIMGDVNKLSSIENEIKALTFRQYKIPGQVWSGQIPNNITPVVFKKTKGKKAKGVDIQMTVDILSNVYQDNVDVVYLVSGDGDYLPVIKEIIRKGKHVYVAAFSDGLNRDLVNTADRFLDLDSRYFKERLVQEGT